MRDFRNVAIFGGLAAAFALAGLAQAQTPGAPPPPPASLLATPAVGQPAESMGCVPMGLFRAVVRNVTPGLQAADRQAQPRTYYRQGAKLMRSEEQPDPSSGAQNIVIVAEPDIWVLNVVARQAQHGVDPGPDLDVHAPILPPSLDTPESFRTLEFGCETVFVATYAPRQQRMVQWGGTVAALHAVTVGDQSLAILMDQRRNQPLMISYIRRGQPVLVLRYDDYRLGQPERPQLFAAPKGYKISESKGPPATFSLN